MKAEIPLIFIYKDSNSISHIAVEIIVNDKTALMIVDTGASNTIFDKNLATDFAMNTKNDNITEKAIGLGANQLDSSLATNVKLKLSNIVIDDYIFVLLDLSIINSTFMSYGEKTIYGIIGTDLLLMCNAVIDYRKKSLVLNCTKKILKQKRWLNFINK